MTTFLHTMVRITEPAKSRAFYEALGFTFEREMDMTFEENERLELADVRDALARLDAGTYGTCARCSADIPSARLEAMPTATLCITCKEAEESR